MDNRLSSDDDIFYLISDFNISAHNVAVVSKIKRYRRVKPDTDFKTINPLKTSEEVYFSKTGRLIHFKKPAIFSIKPIIGENGCKAEPAGCFSTILSENFDIFQKKLLTNNLSYKQLKKYSRYECN